MNVHYSLMNPNCDGSGPCHKGEVRVLPTGGDSNAILCRFCFGREIAYRRDRNRELADFAKFKLPAWEDCRVYGREETQGKAINALANYLKGMDSFQAAADAEYAAKEARP